MKDGLTGDLPDVQPDVEAIDRGVLRDEQLTHLPQQRVAGQELVGREVEVVAGVPPGDHQRVSLSDGEEVPERVCRAALEKALWPRLVRRSRTWPRRHLLGCEL